MPTKKRYILSNGKQICGVGARAFQSLREAIYQKDKIQYYAITRQAQSNTQIIERLLEQLPSTYTLLVITEPFRTRKNKSLYLKYINQGV